MNDQPFRVNSEQRIKRGDLRDMQKAQCSACAYTWFAPTVGRCPRCHAAGVSVTEKLMIGAPRV